MNERSLIPKFKTGQHSVVFTEVNTGILLTPQGERHTGQAPCYQVFNSKEEAVAFARAYVDEHPAIECSIRRWKALAIHPKAKMKQLLRRNPFFDFDLVAGVVSVVIEMRMRGAGSPGGTLTIKSTHRANKIASASGCPYQG